MIDLASLERMSADELRTWLLARMRGEQEDPPLSTAHLETPFDFVRVAREQSADEAFQARLDQAAVQALREAGQGDLREGRDARAVRALTLLVDGLDLRDAVPALQEIAARGVWGGREGEIAPDVESAVLIALAGLQPDGELWAKWRELWRRAPARLWPVIVTGMRRSDASRALLFLDDIIARAGEQRGFPLGPILWGFGRDPHFEPGEIAHELKPLGRVDRERCRAALRAVGATDDDIDAWVPPPRPYPAWAQMNRRTPATPPRPSLDEARP